MKTSSPLFVVPFVVVLASAASAQSAMSRVSVDTAGGNSNSDSGNSVSRSSGDGRYVAFESWASDLVAGDMNGVQDIFVRDRLLGVTVRVSVDSNGVEGNDRSEYPSISADGRFVAFHSQANNLVAGDSNRRPDVFVHDRDPDGNGDYYDTPGVTTRVSVRSNGNQAKGGSYYAMISPDGGFVVFASDAANLVNGDTNGLVDTFLHDRATATTTRVSVGTAGNEQDSDSYYASVSNQGLYVAFASFATNLVANDNNNATDIFVRDVANGLTTRVSVDSSGGEADLSSGKPSISGDGQRVVFSSNATNLDPNDSNGTGDIYLHDAATGVTTLLSVGLNGGAANDSSQVATISTDGSVVVWDSYASDLTAVDTNKNVDVFARDLATGVIESLNLTVSGQLGNGFSFNASVSGDGKIATFTSSSSDITSGDDGSFYDVFAFDRSIGIVDATWSNYGAGWPGLVGIPALTATADPVLGTSLGIALGDSTGLGTVALLMIGVQSTSVPTSAGGTLLVVPLLVPVVGVPSGGLVLNGALPSDPAFTGLHVYLQALELDAVASNGLSFSEGLDLRLGW